MSCVFSKRTLSLALLLALGIAAVIVKTTLFPLPSNVDYRQYIETARLFSGEESDGAYRFRILKPLVALMVALVRLPAGSFHGAFLSLVIFFYFALIIVFFFFAREFLESDVSACLATALFAFGYPMLRYGLDLYTETGALFFYILSLYWTLLFLRNPSQKVFVTNIATITLGFFWKEYSIVSVIIFNWILIIHPAIERRRKAQLLAVFNSIFLGVHALWQLFVYLKFQYTYLQWYGEGLKGFAIVYDVYHVGKSLFGVLMLGWLLVIVGLTHREGLNETQKKFLAVLASGPLVVFLWGWVCSRYYQVLAPAYILLAVLGMEKLTARRSVQMGIMFIVILGNFVWLYFSYIIIR